jgi:hypothetical protein
MRAGVVLASFLCGVYVGTQVVALLMQEWGAVLVTWIGTSFSVAGWIGVACYVARDDRSGRACCEAGARCAAAPARPPADSVVETRR